MAKAVSLTILTFFRKPVASWQHLQPDPPNCGGYLVTPVESELHTDFTCITTAPLWDKSDRKIFNQNRQPVALSGGGDY